jgi:hypothetical protein
MSRAYLCEWAAQLCARFPGMGAIHDLAHMTTAELSGLIAFLEAQRALEAFA